MEQLKTAWAWVAQLLSDLHSSAAIMIREYPAVALWIWLSLIVAVIFFMWG